MKTSRTPCSIGVIAVLLAIVFTPFAADAASHPDAPTGLMCDLLAMPERVEISNPAPRFSWIVNSTANDDVQSACEIRVAETVAALAPPARCLWDSGKIASGQSTAVAYSGPALMSRRSYWWTVRTWDRQAAAGPWSAAQQFRTGVLRGGAPGAAGLEERGTVVRYPIVQTEVAPISMEELEQGHYFIDFGRDAYAALRLTLAGAAGGPPLVVHLGEALEGPHHINRKPPGSVRYHRAELAVTAGKHSYAVPLDSKDGRRMPPEIGAVMPFRYVEVENCPSPLDRDMVRQLATHYPFNDDAARFTSSDPTLNEVWALCRYSMKATSFCGVYVDGDRERLPYEADAYINQLGHYGSDREFTLARYSHEHLMVHPTWPTEWILHSVLMAWVDYLYSGDDASLAEFYDDLKAKTLQGLARGDGLVSTGTPPVAKEVLAAVHSNQMIRDIVDWPPPERDGYDMRPVNSVVNAFHYRAMVLMARIADTLHKPRDAEAFRHGAERVAQAFNARLFSPTTGLYVDGEGSRHSSLHANMFALAFELVPPERTAKVAAFIRGKGMACSVYGAQYLLEALYQAGEADQALALLTSDTDRGWYHMIHDVGTTITLEAWDQKYKPNQDWNHAWGAAPANIIPRWLMGVQPLEPGFAKMRIRPQPGRLQRAALDLPTIRGTVHLDFASSPARFALNVRLPANTSAEIDLPRLGRDDLDVTVDGVHRLGRAEGRLVVIDAVGSGPHSLVRGAAAPPSS